MFGTTLGDLDEISLGTYYGTVIRDLKGSTEVIIKGNFEGLLLGD